MTKRSGNIRNRYFAKIYWTTQYCLLQKYGKAVVKSLSRNMGMRPICFRFFSPLQAHNERAAV
ncbi:MAG: hypothetical protein N0A00_06855 [Candidatus Bathyarchaeota archaeon]|nr:hypothetical protein [Candidatus Bathyarchaeota archaeon]